MQTADPELVERIKNGDKAAFSELAGRYADPLFGLAYSLVGSAADAEDIVQEAMLAALRKIGSFEGRSSVLTWLRSIVVFQASKTRRSRRVRTAIPLHDHEDLASANDSRLRSGSGTAAVDSRVDAMAMLETLSPEHRAIVVLRELQQMSYEEISKTMGIPLGTVESRLYRARQELRQRFGGYGT
ncbi:MAG: polymerase, sigma-24 subunit, RpoE [Phycisphaerales bacterium]|nr:polymerase, sigma-24 subunit, RpoE [Phycisphaerales bacterium]